MGDYEIQKLRVGKKERKEAFRGREVLQTKTHKYEIDEGREREREEFRYKR